MRKPTMLITVPVNAAQYSDSAHRTARMVAGRPVEAFDRRKHDVVESTRVTAPFNGLPNWGYTFVTVD